MGGRKSGGRGKGEKGKEWRRERRKVTEGMGGTGQDMGWDGEGRERKRRKGREREERGHSAQTSIPGADSGFRDAVNVRLSNT